MPSVDKGALVRWIRFICGSLRSEFEDMPDVISSQVFRRKETGDVLGVIELEIPTEEDIEKIAETVRRYVGIDTPLRYSVYVHRNARKRFEPAQWVMVSVPDEEVADLDEDDL